MEEVENDPTYTDEQRQLYRDRLDDLNTEKQARLEILSQNRKDLQTQVARIKQTIEKVLDKNTSLAERIRTFFCEQGITIFSIMTAFSMTISTIVLAITGAFGGGGGTGGSTPKDEGILKKWLDRLADALKRLAGKAVEALTAIVGSAVGAILSFLGKAVGFVAEHAWALTVFVEELIGEWLMQKVKKKYTQLAHIKKVDISLFYDLIKVIKILFLDGRCSQGIKDITWNISKSKMTLKTFYVPLLFKPFECMDTIRVDTIRYSSSSIMNL